LALLLRILLMARARLLDKMPLVPMLCPPSLHAPTDRINVSAMTTFNKNGGEHRAFVIVADHIRPGGVPTTATSRHAASRGGHAWSGVPKATN
jgi:hypothetical protein